MRKLTKISIIISLITLSLELQTIKSLAQGIWNQKADCTFGGDALANFSIGNNGYMLQYPNSFFEWNKNSNIWIRKSDFPGPSRGGMAGFSIGTKGYVFGGQEYGNFYTDLWEWDSQTDTWTEKANKSGEGREYASAFSIGNKGYIVGGYTDLSTSIPELWEWDQSTNSWTQKAICPCGAKEFGVAFSIGTKAYFGTGGLSSGITKDFWEWDQLSNSWSQKSDFGGVARGSAIGFSIGTKGYIGTGRGHYPILFQDFWEWNQSTDTWTQKSNVPNKVRYGAISFTINDKGYVGAGTYIDTSTSLFNLQKDFWEFDKNCVSQTISIAAGLTHSLFLCNGATGMSCGNNLSGNLGDGTTTNKLTPIEVSSISNITAISAGAGHSIFLKNDSTVWTCGGNYYGALGDGTYVDKSNPIQVASLSGIIAISAGCNHSLFLKNDGTVWACGYNNYGQLGDGTTTTTIPLPIQLSYLNGITAISAGYEHSLFLKNDGTVWACGTNSSGELGDGTTFDKLIPVQVNSLSGIIAITAGDDCSFFLKNDGTVWACGNSGSGELGIGSSSNIYITIPVQVNSLSGITAISNNNAHTIFLKNDGSVWACGRNNYGTLGDGTTINKSTPVQVNSLSGIIGIAAGAEFSLFLKNDGTAWACGINGYGQLGDGTNVNKSVPVQVIGLCITCDPPPAPTATNAIICANNTASLSATGNGTLSWYDQANGGTYLGGGANYNTPILTTTATYYVQDSTCAASATRKGVLVTVNPLPVIIANASAASICEGAAVTLTGGGATSYSWSDAVINGLGFIPITTTTYSVTGTDGNNCSNTATKTINVNPLPTITANASATSVCAGTSVILTGGGAASYAWSVGVTNELSFVPSTTTTYTVTGTDGNNCSNTAAITVHVNPLPDIAINISGLTISANQNGAIYQWLNCNNASSPIADAINQSYTGSINGNYSVVITMNNCSDTSNCVNITTTGIEKPITNNNQLRIFPNPSKGLLTIQSTLEGDYTIRTESGQTIQSFKLNSTNNYTINMENLSNGTYFIVGFNNNQMTNQKVVVSK